MANCGQGGGHRKSSATTMIKAKVLNSNTDDKSRLLGNSTTRLAMPRATAFAQGSGHCESSATTMTEAFNLKTDCHLSALGNAMTITNALNLKTVFNLCFLGNWPTCAKDTVAPLPRQMQLGHLPQKSFAKPPGKRVYRKFCGTR